MVPDPAMACTRIVALGGALKCCSDAPTLASYAYGECAAAGGPFRADQIDLETRMLLAQRAPGSDLLVGRYFADDLRVAINGSQWCPFSFALTLAHDEAHGFPLCADVDTFTPAATCPSATTLEAVAHDAAATARLEGLADAANAAATAGVRVRDAELPAALPRFSQVGTNAFAYDLAEAYVMAHLRDQPLDDLAQQGTAAYAEATRVLSSFLRRFSGAPATLRPETLFRCPTTFVAECRAGPYVSQLLFRAFYDGGSPRDRRFVFERDAANLTRRARLLDFHRGVAPARDYARDAYGRFDLRYVHSGRVLASIVHSEPPHKHYYEGALAAMSALGEAGLALTDGFSGGAGVAASTTAGYDDVLASVAGVTMQALRQSYAHKWIEHRKIRPDAVAMRLDTFKRAAALGVEAAVAQIPLAPLLVSQFFEGSASKAAFMEELADANLARAGERNYLLPLLYPPPGHPSSTHGHAVVAGACATVLKAMLTTTDAATGAPLAWGGVGGVGGVALTAGAGGETVRPYNGSIAGMTLEGEIDKLAHNVAAGRNWAGVHFRTELEYSLFLGEAVGLRYLRAKICEYHVARTGSFRGWDLRLFNGTRLLLRECNATTTASAVAADTNFGFHDVPGTSANFERLIPKPRLDVRLPGDGVEIDGLALTQRQMAFGDASIRQATVTLRDADGAEQSHEVQFGAPHVNGTGGTLLTDLSDDPFGRCGTPEAVTLALGNATTVASLSVVVDDVYDLAYPDDDEWGVCTLAPSHSVAGTAANFARLAPKPQVELALAHTVEVSRIELTQRQMAFGDASVRRAELIVNDAELYTVDFGAPEPGGAGGTLLTDLSDDVFGRAGAPAPVVVVLDAPTNITRLRVVVREIYDLEPPAVDLCADDAGWATWLGYFSYARQGSWNVGFTRLALYDGDALVAREAVEGGNATSNGAFVGADGATGLDIFHPHNPFLNAYTPRSFDNGVGGQVDYSWCWWGESVLAAAAGTDEFKLTECYEPAEQAYRDYARNGTWNVGLTELRLLRDGAAVPQEAVLGADASGFLTANATANGAFAGEDAATGLDIFSPENPLLNAYLPRAFDNGVGCAVSYSWCWFGESVLAGQQNALYQLAPPTTVAFGFHDVPGTPTNFLYLTPKPTLTMSYAGAAPLLVDEIRFVTRQMAFGDSTTRRADVTLNGETYEVFFGKADPGDPTGASGNLWTDLSLDQYGRYGSPQPVSLQLPAAIDLRDFALTVEEIWPFEPPLSGTGGSSGDCGGRDIYTDANPTSGFSGGGKDRFGVLTRFGSFNVGFSRIQFYREGALVPNFLGDATVSANGAQNEDVSQPLNAFKNAYEDEYPGYAAVVGSEPPDPFDPKDVCNNLVRAWSFFGTRVLGGFEPGFRLLLNPNLVTTEQYVENVGEENLPALLVQLALEVGEAGFVPE